MIIARCTADSFSTGLQGGSDGSVWVLVVTSIFVGVGVSTFGVLVDVSTFWVTGNSILLEAGVIICGGSVGQSHFIGKTSSSFVGVFKVLKININTSKQTDKPIADRIERGEIRRILLKIVI